MAEFDRDPQYGDPLITTEALVLTHNAPASLRRCLNAIRSQTRPPGSILVVDNASDPPVELETCESDVAVRVIRSDTNLGPAGGWFMAMKSFLQDPFDLAWVMDDDIVPEPDCLERLYEGSRDDLQSAFAFPYAAQPDGTVGEWGAWCGFLIAKDIVKQVGLPRADLFWWAEDTEYCHWRIPEAGYPRVMIAGARVRHDAVRHGRGIPTWKYYYETRNLIYLHLHIMRRVGWFPRNFIRLMARALFRERSDHLRRFVAIGAGAYDGVFGRLGIRYPVVPMAEHPVAHDPIVRDERDE